MITQHVLPSHITPDIETSTPAGEVRIKSQIWDTAGQERYASFAPLYYRHALGLVLVYDITNRQSFRNAIKLWLNQVREHADEHIVVLLVGNKSDLEAKREVPINEAKGLAGTHSGIVVDDSG